MRFEEIEIFGFGKLREGLKIPFSRAINLILAPNDKGKSTLQEALFAMLYPFGDSRSEEGRRKRARFRPWRAERYGGSLTFSLDSDERYRIEKLIGTTPREDKVGVFRSSNGGWHSVRLSKQDRYLGLLTGRHFLGIGRDVFEGLSIVRQFDVASLGEKRRILDEIRSIIEMGKSGEGLQQALKKLQDRKNYIGVPEKKGKRTIAGSKQIRLEEVEREISHLQEQLERIKAFLLDKKKLELELAERIKKLNQELSPEVEKLRGEVSEVIFYLQREYEGISPVIKEMKLQELQNLKTYRDSLAELKIRFETKEENIKKTARAVKNNLMLTAIFFLFSLVFLLLWLGLDIQEGKLVFPIFSFLLLAGSGYLFRILRIDKKFIADAEREKESLIKNFYQQSKQLRVLENVEEGKGVQFYQELWELFLKELGVASLEELEVKWHRARKLSEIINRVKRFNLECHPKEEKEKQRELDLEKLDSQLQRLEGLILRQERLEDEIAMLKDRISSSERTLEGFFSQEDLTSLYTEKLVLEEELEMINSYRQALELSLDLLRKAGEELYAEVTPYINEFINRYFKFLSSDYEFVEVSPDLEIFLKPVEHSEVVGVENIGRGMQTSLYLFLRLAIISLFVTSRKESLPFILDETFNVLDDFSENRQRKFLELLFEVSSDYGIQCIYFTCQKFGQYIPIKNFIEEKGYSIREEVIGDFVVLNGGKI